jgi:hypothetical protein
MIVLEEIEPFSKKPVTTTSFAFGGSFKHRLQKLPDIKNENDDIASPTNITSEDSPKRK